MKEYERPIVLTNEELAEGVYAASGDDVTKNCDSKYMNGAWKAATYGAGGAKTYKDVYGCLGCKAFTESGCGLQTHYQGSNLASSYDQDKGRRKPAWEWNGYLPYDEVTDWSNCGGQAGTDKSL